VPCRYASFLTTSPVFPFNSFEGVNGMEMEAFYKVSLVLLD
jgi:hypothetical protein